MLHPQHIIRAGTGPFRIFYSTLAEAIAALVSLEGDGARTVTPALRYRLKTAEGHSEIAGAIALPYSTDRFRESCEQ